MVVLYHLEGHVEFAGDLVCVTLVHGFRGPVFERVDQLQCGLPSGAVFDARAVDSSFGCVLVRPVDELVQERAPFLRVGHAPVDEDHVGVLVVASFHVPRQVRAGYGHVEVVGLPAHLPVRRR